MDKIRVSPSDYYKAEFYAWYTVGSKRVDHCVGLPNSFTIEYWRKGRVRKCNQEPLSASRAYKMRFHATDVKADFGKPLPIELNEQDSFLLQKAS
jgi:hypothetical protein